ncbi:hypothetical protein [Microbacterium sp. P03]|uniref:hypothetical protein n=1 Tax=Microbacterium sp. P03 TaxID=3366946 RepID=UPI00374679B5
MESERALERMSRPELVHLEALLGPDATLCRRALTGETGVALPPFTDHHVHLHLIDERALATHGIAGVVDLGGDPDSLARRSATGLPRVSFAGAFLAAPGGYPVGRSWAPATITREVRSASRAPGDHAGAATAVDEQAECGASVIKVALNADAGPVFDAEVLGAIVAAAAARGLPVVAHAQGAGMVEASLDAGVAALAHTPFTTELPDAVIERAARSQAWISTLAIHRGRAHDAAVDNLRRFAAAGGRVLYGTDLGNGDLPVGVNADELAGLHSAGVRGAALVAALTDPWPGADPGVDAGAVGTFVAGDPPSAVDDLARWLAGATVVTAEELVHDDG